MNIIAGFLKSFSPLPSPDALHPQENSDANAQAGKGRGFESVLSGLAQNSGAQNSETAGNGTSVTPQPRSAIKRGEDGGGGQAQDSGGGANPESDTNPIFVKNALTALQGTNGAPSDGNAASTANGVAPPLSLLSSSLLGTEGGEQGGFSPNVNGATNQTQTNPNAASSPKSNFAPRSFSAKASQLFGATIDSKTPNGAPTGAAQGGTTQPLSNTSAATSGANVIPPAPGSNGGKPQIAAVSDTNPDVGSDTSAAATDGKGSGTSFVGKTQKQSDRQNEAAPRDADQSTSSSNTQPQLVVTPDASAMAANAGVATGVIIAAGLQAPASSSSTANGQSSLRAGWTERVGTSTKQQKAVEQSAPGGDSGGSNDAADPTAQAILIPQTGPLGFDTGTGGERQHPSGATQSTPLSQMQTPNPVFAGASAQESPAPLGTDTTSDIKVTVLSSETHFAPPQRLSPVQQIVDAVSAALPSANVGVGAASDSTDQAAGSASAVSFTASLDPNGQAAGPVKVLNLQLEPPNLGSVTIALNLSSGGLSVEMAASQASTVSLIERDKTNLSDQLRDSGYSVASVAVTLGTDQGTAIANNDGSAQGQAGQTFSQNNGQAMSSDGGSSNANGNGQNGGNRPLSDSTGTPDSFTGAVGGGASSGDLYI